MKVRIELRSGYSVHQPTGLYLKNGEVFNIYMDPVRFIRLNPDRSPSNEVLLSLLQDRLHTLLDLFINGGGLSRGSVLFFPFRDRLSLSYRHLLDDLFLLADRLNGPADFRKSTSLLEQMPAEPGPRYIASVIARLYADFHDAIAVLAPSTRKNTVAAPPAIDDNDYLARDRGCLSPIVRLKRFMAKHARGALSGYYVHGSMATLDYVKGWSDVDTLMIIKEETATSPERLIDLRRWSYEATKYFYRVDPLQHHGHFVLTEAELSCFPQTYFPFVLFKYSLSCFNDGDMTFHERDSAIERLNTFWNTCYYFREKFLKNNTITGVFELKTFLHVLLLLPIACLQAKGHFIYKKDSFEAAAREFPEADWTIVDRASRTRTEWPYRGIFSNYLSNRIFELLPNPKTYFTLNQFLNNKIPWRVVEKLSADYLANSFSLAEKMLELVMPGNAHV